MADVGARALQRRLDDQSYPWRQRLKLCEKVFFSPRLSHVATKDKIVLEWLTLACSEQPCVNLEKKVLVALKVIMKLVRSASKSERLPEELPMALIRWLGYIPQCQLSQLSRVICQTWKYVLENEMLQQHFQQNVEQFVLLVSTLIEVWMRLKESETDAQTYELFLWILNWALEADVNIKGQFISNLQLFLLSEKMLRPTLTKLLESRQSNTEILENIKYAVGNLTFPKDIEVKVKEVVSYIFYPDGKSTTYLKTFLSTAEQLIVASMIESGVATTSLFYDILLAKCRNLKADMKFYLFVILFRILGINFKIPKDKASVFDAKAVPIDTVFSDSDESLRSLWCILEAANRHLSLIITEDSFIISPLQWFQELSSFLLNSVETRGPYRLKCLQSLLNLNCEIILPKLQSVLKLSWISTPKDTVEFLNEQRSLLCHVLETYAKLRQIPKFLEKLWILLSDGQLQASSQTFFSSFINKLGEIIVGIALGQSLGIWEQLLNTILKNKGHTRVGLLVELLVCHLKNIRLADVNIQSEVIIDRVVQLSYDTSTKCAFDLVTNSLAEEKMLMIQSSLRLAESWGELHISLVCLLPKYRETWANLGIEVPMGECDIDLSFIHFYISPKQWIKIWKLGEHHPGINYLCGRLLLQKLRKIVVTENSDSNSRLNLLKSGTEFLINCLDHPACISNDVRWNGEMTDINDQSLSIANWSSICDSVSTIEPYLDGSLASLVSDIVVTTLSSTNDNDDNQKGFHSIIDWSRRLIDSSECSESKTLQSAMMTSICYQLTTSLNMVDDDDISSRSRTDFVHRIYTGLTKLSKKSEVWTKLGESHPFQCEDQHSLWLTVHKASSLLNKAMKTVVAEGQKVSLDSKNISHIYKLFKLLQSLPLEYFLPCNQLRCLVATFGVLVILTSLSTLSDEVVKTLHLGISNLICIFDGLRSVWLFKFVNVNILFEWMLQSLFPAMSHLEKVEPVRHLQKDCKLLLEILLSLVKKDSESMESFGELLTKVNFDSNDSISLPCGIIMIKSLQTKMSNQHKNKFDALCASYHGRLTKEFVSWVSNCLKRGTVEQMESDDNKMASVLEGLGLILDGHSDDLELDDKLIDFFHRLAVRVATNSQNVDCLRHSCRLLHHMLVKGKLDINGETFEEAWVAIAKLYEDVSSHLDADEAIASNLVQLCDINHFNWIIKRFFEQTLVYQDERRLISNLRLWKVVLSSSLGAEKKVLLVDDSELSFLHLNNIIAELTVSSRANAFAIISDILELEISMCKAIKLTPKCLSLCLQSCIMCHLDAIDDLSIYSNLLRSILNLLNEILECQKRSVSDVIAPFLRVIQLVLQSIVRNSQQEVLLSAEPDQLQEVSYAAQRLQRLFALISTFKEHFASVSPYIVSNYITESSSVTLHSAVKPILLEGIYAVMDLLDGHSVALVVASLNSTGREVFSVLYETYKKYYSYTGRI